jgi:hypothetical protein
VDTIEKFFLTNISIEKYNTFFLILLSTHESELLILQKTHIKDEGYLEYPIIMLYLTESYYNKFICIIYLSIGNCVSTY